MLQLSGRPLTGSSADSRIFINRSDVLDQLRRAISLRFNVLLLAQRGMGTTSLVRQLQRLIEDDGHRSAYVDAGGATDMKELVSRIRVGVHGLRPGSTRSVSIARAMEGFERVGQELDPHRELRFLGNGITDTPVVVVDGLLDTTVAHGLFGRLRDEVWELPFRWIVCGRQSSREAYTRPPADAFFDFEIDLGPLSREDSIKLVESRLSEASEQEQSAVERIRSSLDRVVETAEGNPRRLLALARSSALEGADHDATVSLDLSRPEAMLIAELQTLGPMSASNEELLNRLGWTRPRASQVFKQLEDAGVVRSYLDRIPGRPGRPKKVYRLKRSAEEAR